MKITNILNLPEAFVRMAEDNEEVGKDEIRVTSLLNGLCEAELKRRHIDDVEQDVSEMIWLLFGTAVHSILEKYESKSEDIITEHRMRMSFGKSVLTGKCDYFDKKSGVITDYKTCSTWKVTYADYEDWKKQLLLYAVLLRHDGYKVNGGRIIALMKDHIKTKAENDASYPPLPVKVIEFNFTDEDISEAELWASERIKELTALKDAEFLPICTPEERYNSGDKWAVMKKNRKKALKVCDTEEDAKAYLDSMDGDYVEVRKGEDKKCKSYCMVRDFCPFKKGE